MNEENSTQRKSLWNAVSPLWMLRAKPDDHSISGGLCPGVFWLAGLFSLTALHVLTIGAFVAAVVFKGYSHHLLWYLAPVVPLWLLFIIADVKYRMQGTTRSQRGGYDNEVINWFGLMMVVPNWLLAIYLLVRLILDLAK